MPPEADSREEQAVLDLLKQMEFWMRYRKQKKAQPLLAPFEIVGPEWPAKFAHRVVAKLREYGGHYAKAHKGTFRAGVVPASDRRQRRVCFRVAPIYWHSKEWPEPIVPELVDRFRAYQSIRRGPATDGMEST